MIRCKWTVGLPLLLALSLFCFNSAHADSWSDNAESDSPEAKSPSPNIAGSWSGSVNDVGFGKFPGFGNAPLSMDITQVKSKIGGTFEIGNDLAVEDGTIADGSVTGNGVVKFKFQVAKNCAPQVKADLSGGNTTMTGSYFQNTKHCHAKGTFTATLNP